MTFATQGVAIDLMIIESPTVKWYDVVDLKGCGE
jgi:hypothetical protein